MQVLVDGENLRHQLINILINAKKINNKNEYFSFNLTEFLRKVLQTESLEITYYTTRIKQPQFMIPAKLKSRIVAVSEANRRWIADLINQKVNVVKAGYLRVRETNSCIHCGKKTLVLQEKGVDVRIATDLVLASQTRKYSNLVLVSSDSDLIPAIEAARHHGLKVTYFCYAGSLNRSIASQAKKTITFDDKIVLKHFKGDK